MELIITAPSRVLAPIRSCARCGSAFRSFRKHYVCPGCLHSGRIDRPQATELSQRERQIVTLVEQAKANKQIAFELHLTEGTVKEYLYRIFRKLNVGSRTELALRAYRDRLEAASSQCAKVA